MQSTDSELLTGRREQLLDLWIFEQRAGRHANLAKKLATAKTAQAFAFDLYIKF